MTGGFDKQQMKTLQGITKNVHAMRHHCQVKEYLSNKELYVLGQIQDCQFFYMINGIFPITDQPESRKRIAIDLVNAIALTNQL